MGFALAALGVVHYAIRAPHVARVADVGSEAIGAVGARQDAPILVQIAPGVIAARAIAIPNAFDAHPSSQLAAMPLGILAVGVGRAADDGCLVLTRNGPDVVGGRAFDGLEGEKVDAITAAAQRQERHHYGKTRVARLGRRHACRSRRTVNQTCGRDAGARPWQTAICHGAVSFEVSIQGRRRPYDVGVGRRGPRGRSRPLFPASFL